jgi:hypothetical protein
VSLELAVVSLELVDVSLELAVVPLELEDVSEELVVPVLVEEVELVKSGKVFVGKFSPVITTLFVEGSKVAPYTFP